MKLVWDKFDQGFRVKSLPETFDVLQNPLHDLFDHYPHDSGSLEEELMALGSALFREFNGIWDHTYTFQPAGLASDLDAQLTSYYQLTVSDCPPFRYTPPDFVPRFIEQAINILMNRRDTIECDIATYLYHSKRDSTFDLDSWVQKVRPWIVFGFRRAERRWKNLIPKPHCVADIKYHFDDMIKRLISYDVDDVEFTLSWNKKNFYVRGPRYLEMDLTIQDWRNA